MDCINKLAREIVGITDAEKIILFARKTDLDGNIISFKLCVIADGDPAENEGKVYLAVTSPLHFDLLFYTPEKFNLYSAEQETFAHRIHEGGSVLYAKD